MAIKVYVGVGHGGSDSGAAANGLLEKDVNLGIAKACAKWLKNYGCSVKQSRTKDVDVGINDKVKQANAWKADLCIDIHNNAGGGYGSEVYYSHTGIGKKEAQKVLDRLVDLGMKNRGIKTRIGSSGRDYFGMIRDTDMPSLLIECAFLDSKDYLNINTTDKQAAVGKAIAQGIVRSFEIPYRFTAASVKKNSRGESVKYVKYAMYVLGYLNAKPTNSIAGSKTVKAIKAFQKANGLTVNGVFGKECFEKVGEKW